MGNSVIKLNDSELNEISGGISAKKVGSYAIKGLFAVLTGFVGSCIGFVETTGFIVDHIGKDFAFMLCVVYPGIIFTKLGWDFGKEICKKLGIEEN